MSLKPTEIIAAGIGVSARNRPGVTALTTELVAVINRLTMDLFLDAATINPLYVGSMVDMPYSALLGGWARPVEALSVVRLQGVAATLPVSLVGQEVIVVQHDNLQAATLDPSVIELGGVFLPGPAVGSPTGGSLRCIFARRPVLVTLTGPLESQTIDFAVPREMESYYVAGMAEYLAMKDQRMDEIAPMQMVRSDGRAQWAKLLGAATPALRRTHAPRVATTPATVPAS